MFPSHDVSQSRYRVSQSRYTSRNSYLKTSTYTKRTQHYNSLFHTHSITNRNCRSIDSNINTCKITRYILSRIIGIHSSKNIRHSTNNSLSIIRRIFLISGHFVTGKPFPSHDTQGKVLLRNFRVLLNLIFL